MDELEQLALIYDRAEGAVHQAHTAADAFVLVDAGPAILVAGDGVHAAGLLTGPGELDDGVIGAGVPALAALDALALVDAGPAGTVYVDGALGAGVLTVAGQAALAGIGDLVVGGGAGVAGVLDDVDQRRVVVFLGDSAFLHAFGQNGMLRHGAQGQAHGKADTLTHDGALQKDGIAVVAHLSWYDLIGQLLHTPVIAALVGQLGHLGKDALAHIGDGAFEISHRVKVLRVICNIK